MRRQSLNVFRMKMLGTKVVGVSAGAATLKDAINEDCTVKLRILVDRGSIEVFLNDGITVLTHSIIHELEDTKISFEDGGKTVIKSMEINEVMSSWKKI